MDGPRNVRRVDVKKHRRDGGKRRAARFRRAALGGRHREARAISPSAELHDAGHRALRFQPRRTGSIRRRPEAMGVAQRLDVGGRPEARAHARPRRADASRGTHLRPRRRGHRRPAAKVRRRMGCVPDGSPAGIQPLERMDGSQGEIGTRARLRPGDACRLCRSARGVPASAATAGSWVIMMMVLPASFSSRNNARISAPVAESKTPVGSSANSSEGEATRARAMATRCCWPPESSLGLWRTRSSSRICPMRSIANRSARSRGIPLMSRGRITFCNTVYWGMRWYFWKTKPRCSCQHQGKQAANDRTCDFPHCLLQSSSLF